MVTNWPFGKEESVSPAPSPSPPEKTEPRTCGRYINLVPTGDEQGRP